MLMQNMCLINSHYASDMHANKQLVNSEYWSLKYSVSPITSLYLVHSDAVLVFESFHHTNSVLKYACAQDSILLGVLKQSIRVSSGMFMD